MSEAVDESQVGEWGKRVLDELLFRAGRSLTDAQDDNFSEAIEIPLTFEMSANENPRAIVITLPGVDGQNHVLEVSLSDDTNVIHQ